MWRKSARLCVCSGGRVEAVERGVREHVHVVRMSLHVCVSEKVCGSM